MMFSTVCPHLGVLINSCDNIVDCGSASLLHAVLCIITTVHLAEGRFILQFCQTCKAVRN